MKKKLDLIAQQPQLAVDLLAEASGLSKQRVKDAMAKGACWWTYKGKQLRLRKAKRSLQPGTRIQLFYDDQVLARKPQAPTLIANKGRYSVWHKPHGLLSQGSQWGDHCSLLRLTEVALKKPCFLVHRLDGEAAGLILVAHDSKAAGALSALFSGRDVVKVYRAEVTGILEASDQMIDVALDGKPSLSRLTTLEVDRERSTSKVSVAIETGRKHQIRRHLAGMGHPIVGDRLYGQPGKTGLQLEAVYLAFTCPLTQTPQVFGSRPEQ